MTITLDQISSAARAEVESASKSMEQKILSLVRLAFDCAGFASHPKRCPDMAEAANAWRSVVQTCDVVLEAICNHPHQTSMSFLNKLLDYRNEASARMEVHQ